MPDIYAQANEFKARLLKQERAAASSMVRAYGNVYQRLRRELDLLTQQIITAQQRGEEINQLWLYRQERYHALLDQVARELGRFAQQTGAQITKQQEQVINQALHDSTALVHAVADEAGISIVFNRLPKAAVENLVGALSDGSPLASLLHELPRQGGEKVQDALIEGIALGHNPRQIASAFKDAVGGQLDRALTIARTETLRAYRSATVQNYQTNSDVVIGWQWLAAKSSRTCLNCLSRDGSIWPADEFMPVHPNCRCPLIPVVTGGKPPSRQTGSEWFAEQSAETQREMMGDASYEAYRSGQVSLSDFEGEKNSGRWGKSTYQRSLKEILAK